MKEVHEGQCGLCVHFGEHSKEQEELIQIRNSHQAAEDFVSDCGHPNNEHLHLMVTPISSCKGFESAPNLAVF